MNCGHAHADALSFEFAWGGVNWIVDPGTYTYTGDRQARDEFRASSAHNTVTVDDASQSTPNGTFAWDQIAVSSTHVFSVSDDCISFVGSHNAYERFTDPVLHKRSLSLHKGDFLQGRPAHLSIHDTLDAHDLHRYELRFHFSSGCRVTTKGYQVRITASGGRELILMTCVSSGQAGVIQVPARIDQGWVSHGYAHRQPASVVVMEVKGRGAQELTTLIVPVSAANEVEKFLRRWLMSEDISMREGLHLVSAE
jgi:heparinase II/III-like protein